MRTIILLLSIINHFDLDAMKRLGIMNIRPTKKLCLVKKNPDLPTDILYEIFKACAYNKDKLNIITDTIKAFALTHTALYSHYNDTIEFNELMNTIHKIHHSSHENILRLLHPPAMIKQMALQNELKPLLLSGDSEGVTRLLRDGARLDFTYDYTHRPDVPLKLYTPLMLDCNDDCFNLLLENGSNINETTLKATSVLMRAAQFPITGKYIKRIIENPYINIDQTNNYGETALLRCIRKREKYYISEIFVETIKRLLKKGADPLRADKKGFTPLLRAKELHYDPENRKNTVITLIEEAINKKIELLAKDFS